MTAAIAKRIGFIGAGQMARALAGGFVRAGLISGEQVITFDPSADATAQFQAATPGAVIAHTSNRVLADADIVFLAVKPQFMEAATSQLAGEDFEGFFISIAAGISLSRLTELCATDRIVRVMPNTPCLVGVCAAGFSAADGVSSDERELVRRLLEAVGIAFEVDEKLLDAVTGLSGSGPAFVYTMIEALSDGGVRMGLPRNIATALAAQTVRGAATMVLETGEHPAQLKDHVASPGGTTIAGLQALEHAGVRAGLLAAVEAATNRSIELGRQ
jgi:pyrroline-5-carboxylate reductase